MAKAEKLAEQEHFSEKLETALRQGYVSSEMSSDQPTKEERDDQISIITRVTYSIYNLSELKRPIYMQRIVKDAEKVIRSERRMGVWKHDMPSRRSLERSINYAADVDWGYEDNITPLVQVKPGWYYVNPRRFDEITQAKLKQIFAEFKAMTAEQRKKLKEEQMKH